MAIQEKISSTLSLLQDVRNHPPERIVNHLGFRINRALYGYDPEDFNQTGLDVFAQDWDICALLDAFRYDEYAKRAWERGLPGSVKCAESRGSSTGEWYRGNVTGRDLRDTVCIAGSPAPSQNHGDAAFHAVDHVWKDHWDEDLCTVPPDVVTDHAIEAAEEFPEKRIFIHYLQPHYPFIGPTGRRITYEGYEKPKNAEVKFWHQYGFETGGATDAELWQAYLENCDIIMDSVERLREEISGKLAVTADHGQMIGHRAGYIPVKRYGHPPGFYVKDLLQVPWHEFPAEERRTVRKGDSETLGLQDDSEAMERLQQLGYHDGQQ